MGKFRNYISDPYVKAGLIALAGDGLLFCFHAVDSNAAAVLAGFGEAALIFYGRKTWGPAAAYTIFSVCMATLSHARGTHTSDVLPWNFVIFSGLDASFAALRPMQKSGVWLRKNGIAMSKKLADASTHTSSKTLCSAEMFLADGLQTHSRSLSQKIYKFATRAKPIVGGIFTLFHLPGLAGSFSLSPAQPGPHIVQWDIAKPFTAIHHLYINPVIFSSHGLWAIADYYGGGVQKLVDLAQRAKQKFKRSAPAP